jgi:ankyrin repeat protein
MDIKTIIEHLKFGSFMFVWEDTIENLNIQLKDNDVNDYIIDIINSNDKYNDNYTINITTNVNILLKDAIIKNNIKRVNYLLQNGANPNTQDKNGNTVLMIASSNCNTECIKLLLQAGANPYLKNNFDTSVITLYFHRNIYDVISKIMKILKKFCVVFILNDY